MKFFIHGDGTQPENIVSGAVPKAYVFMRFGIDSMNYYEYRRPLTHNWQSVEIPLTQLTAIKQIRDSMRIITRQTFPVPGDPLANFAIRGNPILTRVQFWAFGIANPAERYPNELTTTAWIDELRLLSPENSADWAGVASAEIKLADLGSINASVSNTQPNFHKLEERFGNRVQSTNWSVTMLGNLEKFAPKEFNEMKVPISFTHAEFMETPQYVANSDIRLDEAAALASQKAYAEAIKSHTVEEANQIAKAAGDATIVKSQSLKVQDSWALTGVKLGIPSKSWLIKDTFNKLTFGYAYSQEFERSPVVQERFMWMWQFTTQYSVQISEILAFKPYTSLKDESVVGIYSDTKYNILPVSFSANLTFMRRRTTEQSRFLDFPSPVIRDFTAQRQAQASWKLVENGFLNPSIDYNFTTGSTLVPYELDETGRQRTGSELTSKILFNKGLIDFGTNNTHTQVVTINVRPRLPIGNYLKYVDQTGTFSTTYNWTNPLQPNPKIADIAKTVSFQNTIRFNTSIKLRAMSDDWWGKAPVMKTMSKPGKDTTSKKPIPIDTTTKPMSFWSTAGEVFKFIFLDYEKFDINFTQNNSATNPGVYGGEGMTNFWARGMTFRSSELQWGPSMAYQLGLVTEPHGSFSFVGSNRFPFFGFETNPGKRPPNAVLQDNFNQKTTLEMKTSRPLWEGATLDLTWKTEYTFNRNQTVVTDSMGTPTFTNVMATESFTKTSLNLPTFFGLNIFNDDIERVIELFEGKKANIVGMNVDSIVKNRMILNALSESFHDGLTSFELITGAIGKFLPSVNWGLRWEGIEKWDIWGGIPKKISLEHVYTSKYTETAQTTDNGRFIQGQQVQMGFQPLIGITASFDEKKLNGVLTATLRWNMTNAYQLTMANRSTVSKQHTSEFQAQASYTLKGFEFPLFGIQLKNDLEFSFLGSYKRNQRVTYDVSGTEYYGGTDGRTLDGNSQLILEPRARYSISDKLSAAFFIRYEGTFNEGAAANSFHSFQTGLDIRLSIAGGR